MYLYQQIAVDTNDIVALSVMYSLYRRYFVRHLSTCLHHLVMSALIEYCRLLLTEVTAGVVCLMHLN